MENIVFADIKKFNPKQIVVSYSGVIQLSTTYFTTLMQQLSIISNRKVIFFPNLTSKFAENLK